MALRWVKFSRWFFVAGNRDLAVWTCSVPTHCLIFLDTYRTLPTVHVIINLLLILNKIYKYEYKYIYI